MTDEKIVLSDKELIELCNVTKKDILKLVNKISKSKNYKYVYEREYEHDADSKIKNLVIELNDNIGIHMVGSITDIEDGSRFLTISDKKNYNGIIRKIKCGFTKNINKFKDLKKISSSDISSIYVDYVDEKDNPVGNFNIDYLKGEKISHAKYNYIDPNSNLEITGTFCLSRKPEDSPPKTVQYIIEHKLGHKELNTPTKTH